MPINTGMHNSNPSGSVTTIFSTMRRMVTLHAEPVRNITIKKNNAPSGMKILNRNPTRYD